MLEYCYSQNYVEVLEKYKGDKALLFNAHVLAVADKYQVPTLLHDVQQEIEKTKKLPFDTLFKSDFYEAFDFIYGHLSNAQCSEFVRSLPELLGNTLYIFAKEDKFDALLSRHLGLAYACARIALRGGHAQGDAPASQPCRSCGRSYSVLDNKSRSPIEPCRSSISYWY